MKYMQGMEECLIIQDLQEYFDGLDWYIPTTSPDDFDEECIFKE